MKGRDIERRRGDLTGNAIGVRERDIKLIEITYRDKRERNRSQ